jgi:medium-chain acyl-[acyl-carrier-protein] hydrolase
MADYIVRFQEKEQAHARLFCVPYAGATAACYRPWAALVKESTEICAVEIPGRFHLREQPAGNMQALVDAIYPQILPLLDRPFAFFGHSFGSIIAYEVVKRLQQEHKKMPVGLFVSSRRAPQLPSRFRKASTLTDPEFIDEMQNMDNAIPQAVLKEKELLKLLLPILKEDIGINETYIGGLDPLLAIPVCAYYGTQDNTITPQEVEDWKAVTASTFSCNKFEGGHFFIDQEKGHIISDIQHALSEAI